MHEGLREQVGARHTRLLAAINDELKIQHPGAFHEEGDGEIILPSGVTPRTAFVKIDTSAIAEVILSLVSKVSVPEGWRLVPEEPTGEMVEAYRHAHRELGFHAWANCSFVWPRLLSSSPSPLEREEEQDSSSRSQPEADKCSLTLPGSDEGSAPSGAWRPLTEVEMAAVKHQALGGAESARRWNQALDALHAFAHGSECPPGYSVVRWFDERMTAYQEAMREAHYTPAPPQHSDGGEG